MRPYISKYLGLLTFEWTADVAVLCRVRHPNRRDGRLTTMSMTASTISGGEHHRAARRECPGGARPGWEQPLAKLADASFLPADYVPAP
jgi:hypothetical protein